MILALALLLIQPPLSEAHVAPPGASVVVMPDWLDRPTSKHMGKVYPRAALKQKQSGRAVINCRVQADGKLTDCAVTQETPAEFGFGDAALKLAPAFRMSPKTKNGAPVAGAKVSIPILFSLN